MTEHRKLAAILFADIAGYTAMMQSDEGKTMNKLRHYQTVLKKLVGQHKGEIIKNYGDGSLCLFSSVLNAVHCSKALQETFRLAPVIPLRIGLHLGDVMYEENDIYGNDLNIASRIESIGVAGSILMSKNVLDKVKNQPDLKFTSLGTFQLKNVEDPMEIFALANADFVVPRKDQLQGKGKLAGSGRLKKLLPITGIVTVVLIAVLYNFLLKNDAQLVAQNSSGDINSIAVFPFDVKGSPDIEYLGEGIVDLISIQLDEIPSINSVDPNLIFSKLDKTTDISRLPEKAADLTKNLGATEFILGKIIQMDDVLHISATKYNASGEEISNKSARGNQKNGVVKIIDEITKQLIASDLEEAGHEYGSLAALTSKNFESLKLYLEGEQAFRLAKMEEARELFGEATRLDSTFALAWMRANDSDWRLGRPDTYKQKWAQYKHTMPKKWQEYYDARELEAEGDLEALASYKNLNQRYGETHAFTYRIAEFLFHFGPSYGRSCTEAKPYLLKTLDLEGENLEAMQHLGEIAVMENDSAGLQALIARTSQESPAYHRLKINEFLFKDTVTDADFKRFPGGWRSLLFPKENEAIDFTIHERMLKLNPSPIWANYKDVMKYGLSGKDQALYSAYNDMAKIGNFAGFQLDQYQRCLPATLMADLNYLPLSAYYEEYYEDTKDRDTPWEIYAAIKYAIALNKNKEAQDLKVKLLSLATTPKRKKMVHYYDYSIKAFEARVNDNNDVALAYIDSAYQSPFGYWEIQSSCFDKTIMAANIYAEKGDFEKAISHFGHVNIIMGYELVRSYAAYKKSQWYEAMEDKDNALAKCNLFLESYKDCDEKYKPWVEEVKARKERLIARMN